MVGRWSPFCGKQGKSEGLTVFQILESGSFRLRGSAETLTNPDVRGSQSQGHRGSDEIAVVLRGMCTDHHVTGPADDLGPAVKVD